jgi:hypothetical protein
VSDKVRVVTLKVTLKKGEREGEGLDFPSQTLEGPRRPEGVSLGPHHPYKELVSKLFKLLLSMVYYGVS